MCLSRFTLFKTGRLIYVLSLEMWGINYKNSRGDVLYILTGERRVHKKMTEELFFVLDFQPKLETVLSKSDRKKIKKDAHFTSSSFPGGFYG